MVEGPITEKKLSRRKVRNLTYGGIGLVVLLIVLVGGNFLLSTLAEKARLAEEEELQQKVASLVQPFEKSLATARSELLAVAKDTEVKQALTTGDSSALQDLAESKKSSIGQALRLRIYLPGEYDVESDERYGLSFASIDQLRDIEKGNNDIIAEVNKFGSEDEHIVMATAVNDDENNLLGLLHLAVSVDLIKSLAGSIDAGTGYAELKQSFASRSIVLGEAGNKASKLGNPITEPIANSRFEIAYWPKGGTATVDDEGSSMLPLLVLLIVVLAAAGFYFYKKKSAPSADGTDKAGSKKKKGEVVYQGAVKAIMEGAHPGVEELIPDLPGSKRKPGAAQASVSRGIATDDATVIANPNAAAPAGANDVLDIGVPPTPVEVKETPAAASSQISEKIFRAYDIRGVVGKELTADTVKAIGKAIGSEATVAGQQGVVVGRDGRTHSPELAEALIAGLTASGQDVIDIGMVPTPVTYFATHTLEAKSGVMLTGSHNGPEYNGLKIVIGGETLSGDAVQNLLRRVRENDFSAGQGQVQTVEIIADYLRRISEDIPVALGNSFKIVVDAGNGVAGAVAPQLYRAMGHDVIEMYCDVDGNFPNHHPDPSQPENLTELIQKVKDEQADIGFAFDGDGDRLGVVDGDGNIIWPDRQLMLLAKDVLSRNQGAAIIYDVKCSRYLKAMIESSGGKALMWKTGHSLIKAKMKEVDAPLAGEMSGHIFFKERWYGFDDALYTGARLLEVLLAEKSIPTDVFATIPEGVSTPELRIKLDESEHGSVMSALLQAANFEDAEIHDVDGLRADFPDGWGLVRPSNTSPYLVARFEAENQAGLEKIQGRFRESLLAVKADLDIPF